MLPVAMVHILQFFNILQVVPSSSAGNGDPFAFAGVYDGHGGSAVAEWLSENLFNLVDQYWKVRAAAAGFAHSQTDRQTDRQTDGQTDRQTDRQMGKQGPSCTHVHE